MMEARGTLAKGVDGMFPRQFESPMTHLTLLECQVALDVGRFCRVLSCNKQVTCT